MDSHLSCLHMHAYVMEFTLLQGNFRLQELDLSHNEFCEEGGVLIGPSLGEWVQLPHWTRPCIATSQGHGAQYTWVWVCIVQLWRGASVSLSLCYCSGDSEALHTLDLSWNHLRGKGATALVAGLKVSLHAPVGGIVIAPPKLDTQWESHPAQIPTYVHI